MGFGGFRGGDLVSVAPGPSSELSGSGRGGVPLLRTGRDQVGGSIHSGSPGRCGMENPEGGSTLLKCSGHSIGVQGSALVDSKELWLALGLAESL